MKKLFAILLCFIMIFSLFACGAKVKTVEDYLKDKDVQSQMDTLKETMKNSGIDMEVKAEGNKLIYSYKYSDQIDEENLSAVKENLESGLEIQASVFDGILKTLKDEMKINDPSISVRYLNADGSEILTKEYKKQIHI